MPPPIAVHLQPHDPQWVMNARAEKERLAVCLGPSLVKVHHVGSTSVPGISAKPILDLLPVFTSIESMDESRAGLESLGYEWWGELGLPGRRYCTKCDPLSLRRLVQLHCYAVGSSEIERHIAFRDYLRTHLDIASEYDQVKKQCQELHPTDSHAYGDCKGEWIERIEADALSWW
jgi:GrpB-like predicted nucleotidyltransferase (UPF0157 family)